MTAQMESGQGFIAALDQSGGSTPKALKGYGIEESAWSNDEEMFGLIHEMRSRIITSPAFSGDKVIGAILFERTMDGEIDGRPVPDVLKERDVVPFIKIDKGLEAEADGVQLMKPSRIWTLCWPGQALGVSAPRSARGSTCQSRRHRAIVRQQFGRCPPGARRRHRPIIEPEVNIKSPERAEADAILLDELGKALDALPGDDRVMLKLSIPTRPRLFDPLVEHPRVLRVVALSGGFSRPEACRELARNPGMIASFSRALLEDLRHGMSDAEFDKALSEAIDEIYEASTEKVAA